jgi:hypothetical protein
VGYQRCVSRLGLRFGAHVELIVRRRVLVIPAGIGLAKARRCSYPLLTRDPAGVVEVARGRTRSLGELFALWGQPLGSVRIGAFRGRVEAFLDGRRWLRAPAVIPLRPHAVVVLELGRHVPPHAHYVFPPGL